jgi:hypothetical protein
MNQILDTTQPDQYNLNSKLKYYSNTRVFEQPLFRYYNPNVTFDKPESLLFNPNGTLDKKVNTNTNTQYTRNKVDKPDNKPVLGFDSKYFPNYISKGDPVDYGKKIDIESEFKIPEYSKKGQIPEFKSNDGRTFSLVNDRRRNLDYSEYIPSGSMGNSGFGNINDFSKLKYGDSTRDIQGPSRDKEHDRFHFTYRNYQHQVYGSNPYPADTRYLNKKF